MLIKVDVQEKPYTVNVGERLSGLGVRMREFTGKTDAVVITNSNLAKLYGKDLKASLAGEGFEPKMLEIEDGEEYKTLETACGLYEKMCKLKTERFTPVVGFGGGVIGDLAGFVASTYLRGLPFVNVPTSLIAQVDSAIGGKTGVNLESAKNLVGTFHQPVYVHSDVELLRTLDSREFKSGMGEVIKHAVIKGEGYFKFLEDSMEQIFKLDTDTLELMISESVRIKGEVVEKDEKEAGLRRVLNLGHTIGHGVEAASGYGRMKHGECVSIGMAGALGIAVKAGKAQKSLAERVERLLVRAGLPVRIPSGVSRDKILKSIYLDKKVRNKKLEFVLPLKLGEVVAGVAVEEDAVSGIIDGLYE
ncbi:MAG: 3-dehydroquinate synthase [Elusimicrobia bacterium]|nr:3-dehydroquinate synthase [Elusimicrobiota bacterium]